MTKLCLGPDKVESGAGFDQADDHFLAFCHWSEIVPLSPNESDGVQDTAAPAVSSQAHETAAPAPGYDSMFQEPRAVSDRCFALKRCQERRAGRRS